MDGTTAIPTTTCPGCGKVYDARYSVVCCNRIEDVSVVGVDFGELRMNVLANPLHRVTRDVT